MARNESEKAVATDRYAELNAAFNCLFEPKLRLRHLLELELGAKPKDIETIPSALADLFAEVAMTCRNTDSFLIEKKSTNSPLLQVQLFERGQDWVERLIVLQKNLNHDPGKKNLEDLVSRSIKNGSPAISGSRLEAVAKIGGILPTVWLFQSLEQPNPRACPASLALSLASRQAGKQGGLGMTKTGLSITRFIRLYPPLIKDCPNRNQHDGKYSQT